jgi:hypothetical protein
MAGRQLYETRADRDREGDVALALAAAWSCDLVPAPKLAGFDYLASRPAAVIEIKSRLNREPADHGGWLFVNVHKVESLLAAAHDAGVQAAIFVWHFPREVRWIDVRELAGRPTEVRGRTDRDGLDQRPVYRVALDETGRAEL